MRAKVGKTKSNPAGRYLLAVDPSLTCSGWALFCLKSTDLLAVGLIEPPGADEYLASRLRALQNRVTEVFEKFSLGSADVLVCEGPAPLVKNPQSAIKVEGVRGIFESVARSFGLLVPGRINPRTVQTEILGMRGRQLARKTVKDWARAAAFQLYGEPLEKMFPPEGKGKPKISQDIIDAMLIGTLAVSRVQTAYRSKSSVEGAFNGGAKARRGASRASGWTEAEFKRRFGN